MTLRKATLFFICLSTLALLLVNVLATHLVIDDSFSELEHDHAVRNMERARNAVTQELTNLDDVIVDWAVWDDSKRFMQGRAPDFAASNLNDRTLASLRLAAIVFLDKKGAVVWAQGFDPVQGIKAPLPQELMAQLWYGSPLLAAQNVEDRAKGLLLLPQGVMLAASCPITGSDGMGKPVGTLVMLRPLTPQEGLEIADRVRLPLSLERADSPLGADIAPLMRDHVGGVLVGAVSSDLYCAVLILPDLWGKPALRVVLRDMREIVNRGDHAMELAHTWMILGTLASFAVLLAFLERRVLRRLGRLNTQVQAIGADVADDGDSSDGCRAKAALGRVDMPGTDELSALAQRINDTLAELERSRQNLATQCAMTQEQESYLQQILDSIQAGVVLVDPQTHMIRGVNSFAASRAGRQRDDIVGKLCHGFICPNEQGQCPVADLGLSGEQSVRSLLRKDGSLLPVLKSVSAIERSGKPLLLETFIDVEDLQNAQEALKHSEETYRAVFMNTGTATILIDSDTTITLPIRNSRNSPAIPARRWRTSAAGRSSSLRRTWNGCSSTT